MAQGIEQSIKKTIKRISHTYNAHEGKAFSRYKSWEYCHSAFLTVHQELERTGDKPSPEQIDNLSLELAFYLASWGMYRGSSFLLQRDYKAHRKAVRIILDAKYKDLWDYDPSCKKDHDIKRTAKKVAKIAIRLKESYGKTPDRILCEEDENKEDKDSGLSATLITKILMGTFAVAPAFDRFFIDGVGRYKKDHIEKRNRWVSSHFQMSINKKNEKTHEGNFVELFEFAKEYSDELRVPKRLSNYPLMKRVDMYFWELGYEKSLVDGLCEIRDHYPTENVKSDQISEALGEKDAKKRANQKANKLLKQITRLETNFAAKDIIEKEDLLDAIPKAEEVFKYDPDNKGSSSK